VKPFRDPAVARVFESCPAAVRRRLLALRELIFRTAASTQGVGELEETLKWGEPAYLTTQSRSGSTIRLGWKKPDPSRCAMYFHCQTNLIQTFRTLFPDELQFEANRAIVFTAAEPVPMDSLAFCVAAALTYHRRKASAGREHGAAHAE
jgi:hypothetical protein